MASSEESPQESHRRTLNRFDGYAAALVALLFIIAAGMFAGYCRGAEGDPGEPGPAGEAGPQGPAGNITTVRGPQGRTRTGRGAGSKRACGRNGSRRSGGPGFNRTGSAWRDGSDR